MYFVYSSPADCPDCDTAKNLLRESGEEFTVHRVSKDILHTLCDSDSLSYPQIRNSICGWIGGLQSLKEVLEDPLLTPDADSDSKYVFDSPHSWAIEMYDNAQASFWITKEIRLADDVTHWRELPESTREWLKNILGFFAAADGLVAESLVDRYKQLNDPACRAFLGYQIYNEQVHSQTYATILKTLVPNQEEQRQILENASRKPHIRNKTEWSKRWIGTGSSFAMKTVAYACVELIFFSSSFCSIFWVKKSGVLPGFCLSNEFISRDEGLHGDFACMLYRNLKFQLPEDTVVSMVREAVELEKQFVRESLKVDEIGMKSDLLQKHVEYMGDRVLQQLGYNKHYKTDSPYMDLIERQSMGGSTNFFERTVSEYSRGTLGVSSEFGSSDDI